MHDLLVAIADAVVIAIDCGIPVRGYLGERFGDNEAALRLIDDFLEA